MGIKIQVEFDSAEDVTNLIQQLFLKKEPQPKPLPAPKKVQTNGIGSTHTSKSPLANRNGLGNGQVKSHHKAKEVTQDTPTKELVLAYLQREGPKRIDAIYNYFERSNREDVETILVDNECFEKNTNGQWTISSDGFVELNKDRN